MRHDQDARIPSLAVNKMRLHVIFVVVAVPARFYDTSEEFTGNRGPRDEGGAGVGSGG